MASVALPGRLAPFHLRAAPPAVLGHPPTVARPPARKAMPRGQSPRHGYKRRCADRKRCTDGYRCPKGTGLGDCPLGMSEKDTSRSVEIAAGGLEPPTFGL